MARGSTVIDPSGTQVNVADWCTFVHNRKHLVGQVLGFIYLFKKTKKESRYSLKYAFTSDDKVGVLAHWFTNKGKKYYSEAIKEYIPIKNYLGHVEKPNINSVVH